MSTPDVADNLLMERWSIAELGTFYTKNRVELYRHALRIVKDPALAEEVLQEVILKVILASPELKSHEHALSYMHKAIENLCIDLFRLHSRRPNLVLIDEASSEIEASWQVNQDHADVIATAEDAAIIRQALSLLSPAERAAIVMWEIDGRSSLEISRELGIKESAVRHTVSRARSSLRRILTDLIIDEERGLTALDLLSVSYRKSVKAVKSSSRAVLSLALIVIAFLGFNSLPVGKISPVIEAQDTLTSLRLQTPELPINSEGIAGSDSMEISSPKQNLSTKIRTSRETFLGLDKKGLPKGFTVSDSTGSLGSAYFMEREPLVIENLLASRQLIKTDTGAANIFISQTLWTDENGLSYDPIVSFGQSGQWIPLVTRLLSQEIERQSDGNYLLTANIGVDYEAESALRIKAKAGGRDLSTPPSKLVTRLVLDPSKTNVLAQAVFVVEKGA